VLETSGDFLSVQLSKTAFSSAMCVLLSVGDGGLAVTLRPLT
jgi:hypothetical protein